jgi:hypothetical protein
MTFGSLFDIIDKFRCSKPTFLAFDFPIRGRPTNLATKGFKIIFGLTVFSLLIHKECDTRKNNNRNKQGRECGLNGSDQEPNHKSSEKVEYESDTTKGFFMVSNSLLAQWGADPCISIGTCCRMKPSLLLLLQQW